MVGGKQEVEQEVMHGGGGTESDEGRRGGGE